MYNKPFYITQPVGNNAFSFQQRTNKKLFVPSLKKISSLDEVKLLGENFDKITFEDFDFDDKLQTCFGLENLYETSTQHLSPTLSCQEREQTTKHKPIYIVDNHNHVFYFWYLARNQGIIQDGAKLYHIDEHADTRDPGEYLMKPESEDLQKVFDFTNFTLNVGNYIVPAQKEGLIGDVIQIRGEEALMEYNRETGLKYQNFGDGDRSRQNDTSTILNLDLDFFQPELDYIDYDLKKQVVLDIAKKADLITICTSPFFIEQERALHVLKDIFSTPLA
ncbi:UPF0489 family protein [Candidatus Gracilibacteria bacterium]|nr:UPF0489 family protein [Candidatus Gracilibacteria bacterium]